MNVAGVGDVNVLTIQTLVTNFEVAKELTGTQERNLSPGEWQGLWLALCRSPHYSLMYSDIEASSKGGSHSQLQSIVAMPECGPKVARFLCEIFQILEVGKEFIFLESENCKSVYNLWSRGIRMCILRKPSGDFFLTERQSLRHSKNLLGNYLMCCWKPEVSRGNVKGDKRPPCTVAQGEHCTSAPNHRREGNVEIQPTDGELHDG